MHTCEISDGGNYSDWYQQLRVKPPTEYSIKGNKTSAVAARYYFSGRDTTGNGAKRSLVSQTKTVKPMVAQRYRPSINNIQATTVVRDISDGYLAPRYHGHFQRNTLHLHAQPFTL